MSELKRIVRRFLAESTRLALGFGRRVLPRRVKRALKRIWDPARAVSAAEAKWLAQHVDAQSFAPKSESPGGSYDIVCLSIVDWDFRWQRPQQLMKRFALAGHRVFYVSARSAGGTGNTLRDAGHGVHEVTLGTSADLDLSRGRPVDAARDDLVRALERLRSEQHIDCAAVVVHLPAWCSVAEDLKNRFGWRIVYDCMDDWETFPSMPPGTRDDEEALAGLADLVSVTGARLEEVWRNRARRIVMVRNGADFEFFSEAPPAGLLENVARPIAGYFGAIAEWMDLELLERLAESRPNLNLVLIGGVFRVNPSRLASLPNVHLLGNRPYELMPAYLQDFDVCLIPFRVDEVTRATDPVKLYEYFSQGKPVVSTPLPEIARFGDLIEIAEGSDEFIAAVDRALLDKNPDRRSARITAARENDWSLRVGQLDREIAACFPLVSIIIVSYNGLTETKLCLESVMKSTHWPRVEVIVVDNASSDGSREFLAECEAVNPRVRVIQNDANVGFARANNQAIEVARGDVIVLLNNDTVVAGPWLARMTRHLDDPAIGLVVATTNQSGNESRIDVPYRNLEEMPAFASRRMQELEGRCFDIRVAAMYCVAMRRDVCAQIGPLDERFTIGLFEDDDYSHRVRLAGLRVVCAEDVFVHHFGQASFGKLPAADLEALWNRNRALFEEKWSMPWEPHQPRQEAGLPRE